MARPPVTNKAVTIPTGRYLSLAQVAQRRGVYPQTVLYWIKHGWLRAIQLPGLGYIVNEQDLATFQTPLRGKRRAKDEPA